MNSGPEVTGGRTTYCTRSEPNGLPNLALIPRPQRQSGLLPMLGNAVLRSRRTVEPCRLFAPSVTGSDGSNQGAMGPVN
jgi:hypothetical protein